jgi:hypothetical protein
MRMTRLNRRARPDLELRVMVDGQMVIGPVQAALLEAIRNAGSISAARRQIGASYAIVWKLVAAMNETFFRHWLSQSGVAPGVMVLSSPSRVRGCSIRSGDSRTCPRPRDMRNCLSSAGRQTTL